LHSSNNQQSAKPKAKILPLIARINADGESGYWFLAFGQSNTKSKGKTFPLISRINTDLRRYFAVVFSVVFA
jgi:hypothetical protein